MFEILFFAALLLISALFSQVAERRLFKRIENEEFNVQNVLIFNEKTPPVDGPFANQSGQPPVLVSGSVVIGVSYFKTFAAAIQGLFGGRISQYEADLEGARRQALIRMRQQAQKNGSQMVINVRFETSSLSKQGPKQTVGAVEVLAYGTAIKP